MLNLKSQIYAIFLSLLESDYIGFTSEISVRKLYGNSLLANHFIFLKTVLSRQLPLKSMQIHNISIPS